MTQQPENPKSVDHCISPVELSLLRPEHPDAAGKYIVDVILPNKIPKITKGVAADEEHFIGLTLTNIPDGKPIEFVYWEPEDGPHPDTYRIMIPNQELISEGLNFANCLKTAAGNNHDGNGSPEYTYPLAAQYNLWKENKMDPVEFQFYRLGEYPFGHCGG